MDKSVAIQKKSYFWQSVKIDQNAYGRYMMCHGQELKKEIGINKIFLQLHILQCLISLTIEHLKKNLAGAVTRVPGAEGLYFVYS